jgi:hypothetical protein
MSQYKHIQTKTTAGDGLVKYSYYSNMAVVNKQEVSVSVGIIETITGETIGIEDEDFMDEELSKSRERNIAQEVALTSPAGHQSPMRRRAGTEETHRIRNIISPAAIKATPTRQLQPPIPLSISTPLEETDYSNDSNMYSDEDAMHDSFKNFDLGAPSRDDDTIVSSLSCDEDSLIVARKNARLPPIREGMNSQPPIEVAIPTPEVGSKRKSRMEQLVAGLALTSSLSGDQSSFDDNSPPPVMTRGPSPSMVRPTLGRNRSAPVRMDFSIASSNLSSNRSHTSSIPEDAIFINGSMVEGIRNRDSDVLGCHSSHSALLGGRKRRVHRRSHTGTEISVGSIVGQSTLHTSNTSTVSFTDSEASSVRKALRSAGTAEELMMSYTGAGDGIGCCQVRRPKNIVKEELKYVVSKMASPMRMIPLFKEKKAELKRSKGSLV